MTKVSIFLVPPKLLLSRNLSTVSIILSTTWHTLSSIRLVICLDIVTRSLGSGLSYGPTLPLFVYTRSESSRGRLVSSRSSFTIITRFVFVISFSFVDYQYLMDHTRSWDDPWKPGPRIPCIKSIYSYIVYCRRVTVTLVFIPYVYSWRSYLCNNVIGPCTDSLPSFPVTKLVVHLNQVFYSIWWDNVGSDRPEYP